jgi:5'-nucleotidase
MAGWKYLNRREFIKVGMSSALVLSGMNSFGEVYQKRGMTKLTILYTNDQHSRIDPFPENDAKYAGEGGFAKRASLIEKIRNEEEHVLLLDAGDIFQGTPYFNYFSGEVEYKLMSLMGYDAVTFGNHDFDLGTENIVKQMPHATFDFLNCNYDFSNCVLWGNKKISEYKIYKKGRVKIGVFGLGIDLENLVDKKLTDGIKYNDPVKNANRICDVLKFEEKCDFIICLSHLGFHYSERKISDLLLAENTRHIDLIIGGHTHTFLEEAVSVKNQNNGTTTITQVGWGGIWLGKADILFAENNKLFFQNNSKHTI